MASIEVNKRSEEVQGVRKINKQKEDKEDLEKAIPKASKQSKATSKSCLPRFHFENGLFEKISKYFSFFFTTFF